MPATLKTSGQLREDQQELLDEAQAINAAAEGDSRELTEEEDARYMSIMEEGGLVDGIVLSIGKAEKREKAKARLVALRSDAAKPNRAARTHADASDGYSGGISLEPRIKACGALRSFKGPSAAEDAYVSGRVILAVAFGHQGSKEWCENHGVSLAVEEKDNTTGGVLVPTEMSTSIINLREEFGVVRRSMRVFPMASDNQNIPRRKTGVTAYAVGEGIAITESNPTFDVANVTAKKWGVLSLISSEIAEDAIISLADFVAEEMALAFADKEDDAMFNGDGTSTYHQVFGITQKIDDGTHTAGVIDAATGNDSFEDLDLADFEKAVGSLPEFPGINPRWYISRAGYYASMARLVYAAGGNDRDDIEGGTGRQFLGIPVVISQKLNSTLGTDASTIKCLLGDLDMCASFGERRGFTFDSSTSYKFNTDQIAVKATTRFGMAVHSLGDNTDAGPMLGLKTAA